MQEAEPVWAKYITEDNLPSGDLQALCSIIGFEATKKLMIAVSGNTFKIHAYCNQQYKKQYIIDNYKGTKKSMFDIVRKCHVPERYVYKVIKEHVEGKK